MHVIIYTNSKNRKNWLTVLEVRRGVTSIGHVLTGRRYQGQNVENSLYLNRGCGYMDIDVCKNVSRCTCATYCVMLNWKNNKIGHWVKSITHMK